MMTLKEMKEFAENHKDLITDIYFDSDISDKKQYSEWYGGTVIRFKYKNRFEIYVDATGDTAGTIYKLNPDYSVTDEEWWKDKNNAGVLGELLTNYGCNSDEDFYIVNGVDWLESTDAEDIKETVENMSGIKALVCEGNNNWFDVNIYDTKNQEWLDTYLDNITDYMSDVFDLDWLDDLIKTYTEEE